MHAKQKYLIKDNKILKVKKEDEKDMHKRSQVDQYLCFEHMQTHGSC